MAEPEHPPTGPQSPDAAPDAAPGDVPHGPADDFAVLMTRLAGGDRGVTKEIFTRDLADSLLRVARRLMRSERDSHTLSRTALVNVAVERLLDNPPVSCQTPEQLFAVGVLVMRRSLVDHARRRKARGAATYRQGTTLLDGLAGSEQPPDVAAELAEVFDAVGKLAKLSPRAARAVYLRYWNHMTVIEVADELKISRTQVKTDIKWANSFLQNWLDPRKPGHRRPG